MTQPVVDSMLSEPLLTKEQVQEWADEYQRTLLQLASLQEKADKQFKRLEAVQLLFGDKMRLPSARPSDAPEAVPEEQTWREAIMEVLSKAQSGLQQREIAAALKETSFRERYNANPNGLYTAINKMIVKGEVERIGAQIFTSSYLHNLIKDGGDVADVVFDARSPQYAQPNSAGSHVFQLLKAYPEGLRPIQIIDMLKEKEGVPSSLFVHTSYLYTVLNKLVNDGSVVKSGKAYRAIPKK